MTSVPGTPNRPGRRNTYADDENRDDERNRGHGDRAEPAHDRPVSHSEPTQRRLAKRTIDGPMDGGHNVAAGPGTAQRRELGEAKSVPVVPVPASAQDVQTILGELVEFLDTRVIPRLPASCEWKWVLVRLRRALTPPA